MKKVVIVYNPDKPKVNRVLNSLKAWLRRKNIDSVIWSGSDRFPKADLCITLGGDGTILKTAKKTILSKIPILGINLGSLGFLAEVTPLEMYKVLSKVISKKCHVEERMLLDVEAKTKNSSHRSDYTVVNDCVVRSGIDTRVILLRLMVNNEFLAEYVGDGVIISTPTGSTAYSLAAQGPVVHPELETIVITAICPHTLSERPLLLAAGSTVSIEIVPYKSNKGIVLSLDGQDNVFLNVKDKVIVRKSKHKFKLITHPQRSYYEILRAKLRWGK